MAHRRKAHGAPNPPRPDLLPLLATVRNAAINLADTVRMMDRMEITTHPKFLAAQERFKAALDAARLAGATDRQIERAILDAANRPDRAYALRRFASGAGT